MVTPSIGSKKLFSPAYTLFLALIFVFSGFSVLGFAAPVDARFREEGIKNFNSGHPRIAADELLMAILVNFSDKEAFSYLEKIVKSPDGLSQADHATLSRIVELIDQIVFLRGKTRDFFLNNESVIRFILKEAPPESKMMKEVHAVQSTLSIIRSFSDYDIEKGYLSFPETDSDRPLNWSDLKNRLSQLKADLMIDYDQLNYFSNKLHGWKFDLVSQMKKNRFEAAETGRIAVSSAALERPSNDYNVKNVEDQPALVEDRVSQTEQRVVQLTRDVAAMSLEVFEKNRQIGDKDLHLKDLEGQLLEAKGRLDLVQHLIQEKDKHIRSIEEKLKVLQGRFDTVQPALSEQSGNLMSRNDFVTFQSEIRAQSLESDARIASLGDEFDQLKTKYAQLEEAVSEKNKQIEVLMLSNAQKKEIISALKFISGKKDIELDQLNGIIEIYRWKLGDIHSDLREKNEMLENLENQLQQIPGLNEAIEKFTPGPYHLDASGQAGVINARLE